MAILTFNSQPLNLRSFQFHNPIPRSFVKRWWKPIELPTTSMSQQSEVSSGYTSVPFRASTWVGTPSHTHTQPLCPNNTEFLSTHPNCHKKRSHNHEENKAKFIITCKQQNNTPLPFPRTQIVIVQTTTSWVGKVQIVGQWTLMEMCP